MPAWTVTVIDRKDKSKTPQETRLEDDALTTEKKVKAFVKSKWKHLRLVSVSPVAVEPSRSAGNPSSR